jgi:hypothetical protein
MLFRPFAFQSRRPILAALVLLLALSACSLLREQVTSPRPAVIRASADQIARAMQEDHFFSDYGHNTLIVQGTALAIRLQGARHILELKTNLDTVVLCDFGSQAPVIKAGELVTVESPDAGQAQRQPNAVLLANCSIP